MSARAGKYPLIVNFAAFQTGWFSAVLGGAHGYVWLGSGIALLVMLLHLFLSLRPLRELQLLIIVMLLGLLWDSALATAGVINYFHWQISPRLAPVWIVALWGLFATTLNVSLAFLRRRYLMAALFGFIGAPLSFMAGVRLQALQFPDPVRALWVLAIGWSVLMVIMVWLAERYDGISISAEKS